MNVTYVKIGEVKVGGSQDILKATLGSCVGIAFLWKQKKIYGLAHCLLPETEELSFVIGAKYVDQAIKSLIALLKIKEEFFNELEVHIAGGGNMMGDIIKKEGGHIGALNVLAAKKFLAEYKIKIDSEDLGGNFGRQMILNCAEERIQVNKLSKGSL